MLLISNSEDRYSRSCVRIPACGQSPLLSSETVASRLFPSSAFFRTRKGQTHHAPPSPMGAPRGVLERHPNPMVVQSHVSGRGMKVLAETCGGSRARGREGLSGLPQHQKPARMRFGKGSTNSPPCPWAVPCGVILHACGCRVGCARLLRALMLPATAADTSRSDRVSLF